MHGHPAGDPDPNGGADAWVLQIPPTAEPPPSGSLKVENRLLSPRDGEIVPGQSVRYEVKVTYVEGTGPITVRPSIAISTSMASPSQSMGFVVLLPRIRR